jgi:glycine cleavage system H protein
MPDYLELKVDKFIFRVATDRWYNPEGVWAKWEGAHVYIGISDYLQQRSGDMAFVELKPPGIQVSRGDEVAVIETIKVNISLPSPVTGRVMLINEAVGNEPEIINQDPYEKGWLAMISVMDFPVQMKHLMEARAYFEKIKREAEQETRES